MVSKRRAWILSRRCSHWASSWIALFSSVNNCLVAMKKPLEFILMRLTNYGLMRRAEPMPKPGSTRRHIILRNEGYQSELHEVDSCQLSRLRMRPGHLEFKAHFRKQLWAVSDLSDIIVYLNNNELFECGGKNVWVPAIFFVYGSWIRASELKPRNQDERRYLTKDKFIQGGKPPVVWIVRWNSSG